MSTPTAARADVIAVVGPTAVGKSALAERLALILGGEIVSADSMQVYRRLDIGTAKTPPEERIVPHHCIDLVDPGTPYSAALYQSAARASIDTILASGATPLVAGGSGLYVRAALDDWKFPRGEVDSPLRESLEELAARLGPQGIHALLADRDPESAALIDPANIRRTIRALEMLDTGESYSERAHRFAERRSVYPVRFLGLTMQREPLYQRIETRVDRMIESGLLHEVQALLDSGFRSALTASQAIGYKELVPVIEQGADLADATATIKRATRRYAKRQMTWFRADHRISWFDVTDVDPDRLLQDLVELLESNEPLPDTGPPAPETWRLGAATDR